jgi:peptidoglycan/xylan/chitin deacetylase (PgdA/CDA1 family)
VLATIGVAALLVGVRAVVSDDPTETAPRPDGGGAGAARAEVATPSPAEVGADESGLIMVLQYHRVGGDPDFAPEWTISPEDFRAQLEYLRSHDYHPINFRDLVENRIDAPPGKTPVVLTFDDSSRTQFTMVEREGEMVPHPDSAVGVLAAFHEEHPEWPMRATFFVLPSAEPPNDLFGQRKLATEKLRYLAENGMEVGSHTLYHANLAESPPAMAREQLARSVVEIQKHLGPDYEVKTLGVPFGAYPADHSLLKGGEWRGHGYDFSGAADVSGGATYPPGDRRFDAYKVPRIQAEPEKQGFSWFADHFEANPEDRYVSDGDPITISVPIGKTRLEEDALRSTGNELVRYRR